VHGDSYVEVEAAYDGAPPDLIGRHGRVQRDDRYVRLLNP
jgi:hypothetical protein